MLVCVCVQKDEVRRIFCFEFGSNSSNNCTECKDSGSDFLSPKLIQSIANEETKYLKYFNKITERSLLLQGYLPGHRCSSCSSYSLRATSALQRFMRFYFMIIIVMKICCYLCCKTFLLVFFLLFVLFLCVCLLLLLSLFLLSLLYSCSCFLIARLLL